MSINEKERKFGFSTLAIHAGQVPAPGSGAIMTPIYQTSTYVQESPGVNQGYDYSRAGNPTRTALEQNLAALEKAKFGISYSSGCAAADAILHLLNLGDHVVCCDDVYGGTYRILENVFKQLGISTSFVNLANAEKFSEVVTEKTKLLWLETPTNPLLSILDLSALCSFAHERGVLVVVDNTFASPYLQNPLDFGADIIVHSTTKYIGGHSDIIGGVVMTSNKEVAEKLFFLQKSIGAVPAPFECFMLLRSTKTLAIRMERHSKNALELAKTLESNKEIEKVIYPGLSSHPQYQLAMRQMKTGGGMLSIELKGDLERTKRFLESVKVFSLAESLGGVESLINHPAIMTHASIPADIRKEIGITDSLIRLSVGVEDIDDLVWDMEQALGV